MQRRKPRKGVQVQRRTPENAQIVNCKVPMELYEVMKQQPTSMNNVVNLALEAYFKDYYKNRLETALFTLYEVLFDIEKLKDLGQIGSIKCTASHLLQIESYQEAIRILENSPLYHPEESE